MYYNEAWSFPRLGKNTVPQVTAALDIACNVWHNLEMDPNSSAWCILHTALILLKVSVTQYCLFSCSYWTYFGEFTQELYNISITFYQKTARSREQWHP